MFVDETYRPTACAPDFSSNTSVTNKTCGVPLADRWQIVRRGDPRPRWPRRRVQLIHLCAGIEEISARSVAPNGDQLSPGCGEAEIAAFGVNVGPFVQVLLAMSRRMQAVLLVTVEVNPPTT